LLRNDKIIGSSLDAEITLYCDQGLKEILTPFANELRFILICSYVHIHPIDQAPSDVVNTDIDGLSISTVASSHEKCVRCWHHREDVTKHDAHPELCGRCIENIDGDGEQREFA